jgi:hypothetical protein
MKHIKLYEEFVNEATTSWKKMMQGVRSSETGPWSIVAIENKKVVGQKIDIRIQDMIPAHYEAMRKEFPRAKIHIEDGTGMVVWNESLIFENISNISDYKPLNTTLDSVRIKDIAKRDKDAVFIIKKEYFGNRFQDDVLAKYDSSYRSITSFAPIGKEKDLKNKDVLSKSELENLSDEIINDKYFQGTIDVLKGNISKFVRLAELNEGNLGVSLKSLPEKIKRKMDYEYDSNTPEYDLAINMLQKYLKNNLTKLENGKSIHSISNKGKDLEEIADLLETTPIDIIEYIDMTIDNIVK